MKQQPTDDQLLAFLTGTLDEAEREAVLAWVEASPEAAASLRSAALGMALAEDWRAEVRAAAGGEGERSDPPATVPAVAVPGAPLARRPAPSASRRDPTEEGAPSREVDPGPLWRRPVPIWAVPAAVAATVALLLPLVSAPAPGGSAGPSTGGGAPETVAFAGAPVSPEPSFVLVLHGRWPDAGSVEAAETRRRAEEYWAWTSGLAERGLLVAAGDLRWEPGFHVNAPGSWDAPPDEAVADPEFLVGMFALRTGSYEEALAVAQESPHLRYGGSISVRRVGGGFVTVPGMGDWSD